MLVQVLEAIMIISFGVSWPISVYKSIKTKSTKGKSLLFLIFIIFGYIAGIIGKIISKNVNWVLAFYFLNVTMVSLDLIVYFINKKREKNI